MNTVWWICGALAIAAFAFFEARAFRHPERQNTLSRWIYDIGKTWPLSIFIMGMFCGGLAVHFFWHWCPPGSVSTGKLELICPTPTTYEEFRIAHENGCAIVALKGTP